jgi:phospholipase C
VVEQTPEDLGTLGKINHFVVLMLENRSFDHVLGMLKAQNPLIDGVLDHEFANRLDPAVPTSPLISTGSDPPFAMPFDPGHEFEDVQIQLYGRLPSAARKPASPTIPASMQGFIYSAEQAAKTPGDAGLVMQCYRPDQLPVLSTLATEFALFNYWHSSLPGPTWPNRFFVHAATSAGLSDSPKDPDILAGYTFPAGTLYQGLKDANREWRIYHDGLPQSAGIDSLRSQYVDIFTRQFRDMQFFERDLTSSSLPEYLFIEPKYDTGHNFVNGNSMHPRNDVREGEKLLKRVYEAIRRSNCWADTMLIVTFDEHGGFFDHVPPPTAVSPGGGGAYADPARAFDFDRLGVRVPALVVSAYTQRNTVVGQTPLECYDHTSILATVQKRFGLPALTQRDRAAATLERALNLSSPRLSPDEAPMTLPGATANQFMAWLRRLFTPSVDSKGPLSTSQRVQLTLAHACDLHTLDPPAQLSARHRYLAIRAQQDAADYVQEVENRIRDRRRH